MNEPREFTQLKITFEAARQVNYLPVYCLYSKEARPQPAYISLDLRTGECTAGFEANLGYSANSNRYAPILTFRINPKTSAVKIEALIHKYKRDFQTILNGSYVAHECGNEVGRLNINADELVQELKNKLYPYLAKKRRKDQVRGYCLEY